MKGACIRHRKHFRSRLVGAWSQMKVWKHFHRIHVQTLAKHFHNVEPGRRLGFIRKPGNISGVDR
jgi:hypothetical protein